MLNQSRINQNTSLLGRILLCFTLLVSSGVSAEWTVTPGVTLEQVFSDNALLVPESEDPEDESITIVQPHLSILHEGPRFDLSLNYAPEYREYNQETKEDEWVQFMELDQETALVKDHLFLELGASIDERTISDANRTGLDGLTGSQELTQVYRTEIRPRYTDFLGRSVQFELAYGVNRVWYSEDEDEDTTARLDDSLEHRADFTIGSSPFVTSALTWNIALQHRRLEYEDRDEEDEINRGVGQLNYRLSRQWTLTSRFGYEEFVLSEQADRDGEIWNLGFIYTPTSRTRLEARGGEKATGEDYFMDFSHRWRRALWTASYESEFISPRNELGRSTVFTSEDAFGEPVDDPASDPSVGEQDSGPTIDRDNYLMTTFQTSLAVETGRTTSTISGFYREREYDSDLPAEDNRMTTITGEISRRLRPSTRAFIRLRHEDFQEERPADDEDFEYQRWVYALGGTYETPFQASITLLLQQLDQSSNDDNDEFEENRATLRLDKTW
jgi:uncharacterized protein (PEP-CTERM system associated)